MKFIQARNYTRVTGPARSIGLVVIHDMEAPESNDTAENVGAWMAGSTAPEASYHYGHDADSTVQCVRDADVAWGAPGANHNGLQIEHAGRAAQLRRDWLDAFSTSMLRDQSAPNTARLCAKYGIPVRFVNAAGLRAGLRGITTHAQVTLAFPGPGHTHTDPGPNFPMDQYIAWVKAAAPHPVVQAVWAVRRRVFKNSGIRTDMTTVERIVK